MRCPACALSPTSSCALCKGTRSVEPFDADLYLARQHARATGIGRRRGPVPVGDVVRQLTKRFGARPRGRLRGDGGA